MAAMAVAGGYTLASMLSAMRQEQGAPGSLVGPAADSLAEFQPQPTERLETVSGDDCILRMLSALERRPNLSAKIRQSLHLGDDHIAGSGEYWQQGVGNLRRTSWRLQSLEAEKTTSYEQIYTGKYLWTNRRVGDEPRVTRVDVERVIRELDLHDDDVRPRSDFTGPTIALARGGLSQLVAELHRSFTFGEPMPARHEDKTVDVMIGRWRPEALERQWPGLAAGGAWPEHLPHHVLVAAGREDLFPYLIEYRRGAQAALAESAAGLEPAIDPLARYEFFEVRFAVTMPEGAFEFPSNDVTWRVVTARVIERLRAITSVASNRPAQK
jgi:hypothetical protein